MLEMVLPAFQQYLNSQVLQAKLTSAQNKEANDAYLADREHTEAREDSAYQRAVADMRSAGLNPYTVGSSPASSSVSNVGSQTISHKLDMLGYILDLKNLSNKNVNTANNILGNILGFIKKK